MTILKQPYTYKEIEEQQSKNGFIVALISLGVDELLFQRKEFFTEKLSLMLTGTTLLDDVVYVPAGVENKNVVLKVTGNAERLVKELKHPENDNLELELAVNLVEAIRKLHFAKKQTTYEVTQKDLSKCIVTTEELLYRSLAMTEESLRDSKYFKVFRELLFAEIHPSLILKIYREYFLLSLDYINNRKNVYAYEEGLAELNRRYGVSIETKVSLVSI